MKKKSSAQQQQQQRYGVLFTNNIFTQCLDAKNKSKICTTCTEKTRPTTNNNKKKPEKRMKWKEKKNGTKKWDWINFTTYKINYYFMKYKFTKRRHPHRILIYCSVAFVCRVARDRARERKCKMYKQLVWCDGRRRHRCRRRRQQEISGVNEQTRKR